MIYCVIQIVGMEIDQSSQESVDSTPSVSINIKNTEPIRKHKKIRNRGKRKGPVKLPYFTSKKEKVWNNC